MLNRIGVVFLLATLALVLPANAQTSTPFVERNLPPLPPERGPAVRVSPDLLRSDDETPLGANLRAIVLIGVKDRIVRQPRAAGVDIRTEVIDAASLQAQLTRFLGRPLSRKVISEIQAEIASTYRNAGRPFVSVTIPPQEITGGVLQIRVVEGRLGNTKITGLTQTSENYIRDRVRLTPGAPIDARRLEEDLDWLNRYPFRQMEAVFGPGKEIAQTDLDLRATESKPWQMFGGYSNTGTRLTGRDRWFSGATAGLFAGTDVVASYQATGSRDFWISGGRPFGNTDDAGYMSHAGRVNIALWPRSSIEVNGNFVQTNEQSDPFIRFRTRTTEISPLYRSAVSNLIPGLFGDWLAGTEFKRQDRVTYFADVDVAHGGADVFQIVGGWAGRWIDPWGVNNLDVRVKHNPGGAMPLNTDTDWSLFTNGRVTDIRTTFAILSYNRVTPLFAGFSLATEVSALINDKPLPDTERLALGGAYAVRGYVTEDGIVDRAVILRDTLYFPSVDIGQALNTPWSNRIVPFVLADVGQGRDIFAARTTTLASVGAGFDEQISAYVKGNLTAAYALRDGMDTPTGNWRVHARVTVSY